MLMDSFDPKNLVDLVVQKIRKEFDANPLIFTKSPLASTSELVVHHAIKDLMDKGVWPKGEIVYSEKSHQFPDIVVEFENGYLLGVEVKSSSSTKSSWSTNGNSVLGSTSIKVDDIYIVFIKYNVENGFDINYARYQDSIADVVVTHSPRYRIDLNLDPAKNFFNRSGIDYQELKNSNNPISLITDYFRKEGKTAWWLGDDNNEKFSSATILSWRDIEDPMIQRIYGEAFVLFPEIINGPLRKKYIRLAKWLAAKYSIADSSLRDKFSAGGRTTINYLKNGTDTVIEDAPKVYKTLFENQDAIKLAFTQLELAELQEFWTNYNPAVDSIESRKKHWYLSVENNGCNEQVSDYVRTLLEINIP